MRHLLFTLGLVGGLASASPSVVPKPDAGPASHGEVSWREQVIRATGSGAPDLRAANPAQARLAAEKAAQLDAFRNLLSQVKGIQVSTGKRVSDLMGESDEVRAQVEGTVRGFRVVKKRYFSDSGVELDVEVPLQQLVELLPPPVAAAPGVKVDKESKYSSLVVDASGLSVTPALAPRLLDGKGGLVFGAEMVAEGARKDGVAHYARSVEEAKKSQWAGEHPLLLKAAKAQGSDLVLADVDLKSLTDGAGLRDGHVIIVTP